MNHYIQREISDHLLKLFCKEIKTMPKWDQIADIIQLAEKEPSFENIRYANFLYHVIADLLHTVKLYWFEYIDISEEDCNVTIVWHENILNQVGIITSSPIKSENVEHFKQLYLGKSLEELNENRKVYEITKFQNWISESDKEKKTDDLVTIENWTNTRTITEKYKTAFKDVLNSNIPSVTFERFIERVKELQKNPDASNKVNIPKKNNEGFSSLTLEDIFLEDNGKACIDAFMMTKPPLLTSQWKFIGSKYKHTGVICSWITHLQNVGIIKSDLNRQKLALILNNSFKDFNMGIDGKTFANSTKEYDLNFKNQLEKICSDITKVKQGKKG